MGGIDLAYCTLSLAPGGVAICMMVVLTGTWGRVLSTGNGSSASTKSGEILEVCHIVAPKTRKICQSQTW